MTLPAALTTPLAQFALAAVLGAMGVYLLLPKPRRQAVALGVFLSIAAAVHTGFTLTRLYGDPAPDVVGSVLFWLFSAGAVGFAGVLVAQRNPARGAIAFAFVILSTCGLFLLLAAPFLMAATVIIYAGAIIVTFLFVLMLSHAGGPSDENDRTREPLLGSLAGFALVGLMLFTLYLGSPAAPAAGTPEGGRYTPHILPAPPVTAEDRAALVEAADELRKAADEATTAEQLEQMVQPARAKVALVVGYDSREQPPADLDPARRPAYARLRYAETDARTAAVIEQSNRLRTLNKDVGDWLENEATPRAGQPRDLDGAKRAVRGLRDEVVLFAGRGELPARNVAAIGHSLYSEHLIAVELAGTLLLVATIGAVAIAQRKGVAS